MKRLDSARARLAVVVPRSCCSARADGSSHARRRRTHRLPRSRCPTTAVARERRPRDSVVAPPAATAAWPDGYRHFIVTLMLQRCPNRRSPSAGPVRTARRGVGYAVSAPGETANLTDAERRVRLPWIRAFEVDAAGATWVRLADDAPAALGKTGRGSATSTSTPALDACVRSPTRPSRASTAGGGRCARRRRGATVTRHTRRREGDTRRARPGCGRVRERQQRPDSRTNSGTCRTAAIGISSAPGDMTAGSDADVPPAWAYTRGRV